MMDDRFEDVVKEAASDYNEPPETPRDLMWARIEATRAERAARRQQLRVLYSPWTRWGIAVAAAVAIGFGLGRFSIEPGSDATRVAEESASSGQLAFRVATTNHLSRAETFLASFRSNPQTVEVDPQFSRNAGDLLISTRLLLDSPAAEDPTYRTLLEDLELVLVQIAQLSAERDETEVEIIRDGLQSRGLLPRLRTVVPAGQVMGS
jgi:hypothetical protein